MEQDRKKRLYELRDAQREGASVQPGQRALEGTTEGDDLNKFLKDIVQRKQQRKKQLSIIQDFFENPAAYGVDTSFIPSSTSQDEIDERREDLQHKLDLLRSVLKALEGEMELLNQVSATSGEACEDADATGEGQTAPSGLRDEPDDEDTGSARALRPPASGAGVPEGRLEVLRDGTPVEQIPLTRAKLLIGRRATNDICLRDKAVSRRHALILPDDTGWSIVDLRSTNGTQVNGQRVRQHALSDRDEITLGSYRLVFYGQRTGEDEAAVVEGDFRKTAVLEE